MVHEPLSQTYLINPAAPSQITPLCFIPGKVHLLCACVTSGTPTAPMQDEHERWKTKCEIPSSCPRSTVWFFCILLEDKLHPLTLAFASSLVTHRDVPWKPFFPPLRALSGLVVSVCCPLKASRYITNRSWTVSLLQILSAARVCEGLGAQMRYFCLYLCKWISAWSYWGQNLQLDAAHKVYPGIVMSKTGADTAPFVYGGRNILAANVMLMCIFCNHIAA